MASSKYGRLFTEQDVLKMLEQAHDSGFEIGSGTAEDNLGPVPRDFIDQADRDGATTFPADEPLFLLRGKDEVAPATLWAPSDGLDPLSNHDYYDRAEAAGADNQFLDEVRNIAADMHRYQREHPDLVKTPD